MTSEINQSGPPQDENCTLISRGLLLLKREINTYRRELPRLLAEGHEGSAVLIKGDQVLSIWDTHQDAYQAGREKFGLDIFLAQPIESKFLTCPFPKEFDNCQPSEGPGMTREPNNSPTSQAGNPRPIDKNLLLLKREINTYRRELPRLLAEGLEGQVVLIKGDQVISIWNTEEDAYQAGREKFGFDIFLAQPIEARYLSYTYPKELDREEAV